MVEIPADLTAEMKWSLLALLPRAAFLGTDDGVPRVTAAALVRRGLAEIDGSLVRLTPNGIDVAEAIRARRARLTQDGPR